MGGDSPDPAGILCSRSQTIAREASEYAGVDPDGSATNKRTVHGSIRGTRLLPLRITSFVLVKWGALYVRIRTRNLEFRMGNKDVCCS